MDIKRKPAGLLLVMIEVEPGYEEEFNRWYREEHYPERMGCKGFVSGRRFVAIEGEPKYLAIYDLSSPDILNSKDYKLIAGPSKWTRKLLPHFVKLVRNVYQEVEP